MILERKGVPKRDGSGRGKRLNVGRGGCKPPQHGNAVGRGFGLYLKYNGVIKESG